MIAVVPLLSSFRQVALITDLRKSPSRKEALQTHYETELYNGGHKHQYPIIECSLSRISY